MNKTLNAVLDWLHQGYPEGVPPKDFYPLLALLARTLREDELDRIVETLVAENPDGDIRAQDLHQAIEAVKQEAPVQADIRDVAARLAAVGWPLGALDEPAREGSAAAASAPAESHPAPAPLLPTRAAGMYGLPADPDAPAPGPTSATAPSAATAAPTATTEQPGVAARVVEWLRAGYPEGVPGSEQVPLLSLLRRRLTDEEVDQIARSLMGGAPGSISAADAEALIAHVKQDDPTPQELDRVASRLAAKGWPLEA